MNDKRFLSFQLFGWLFYRVRFENVVFGLLTIMSIQGFVNLRGQWSILGEFNNLPQEELIEWIKSSTRAGVRLLVTYRASLTRTHVKMHPHIQSFTSTQTLSRLLRHSLKHSFSKSDFGPSFNPTEVMVKKSFH